MLRSSSDSLADPGELPNLDPNALRRYLSFQYVPPPGTLAPPVQVLPPGHAMIARPGGALDVYRYWRADLRPARAPSGTRQAILDVMRDSVAVHQRSDAPLGAFLSGGIDSAAICALAAEHRPDLLTFTVGFEREGLQRDRPGPGDSCRDRGEFRVRLQRAAALIPPGVKGKALLERTFTPPVTLGWETAQTGVL